MRGKASLNEPLLSFLKPFEPINPLPLVNLRLDKQNLPKTNEMLIYASLGTVFNNDLSMFFKIIDSVKAFNDESASNGVKLKALLSTGDVSYSKFQELIQKKEIVIPENILILDKVPQLDVLKRANIFITHSGQGSTSESVHYGVPMICIPVSADQPGVAYRCCDELGLGVRFNYDDVDTLKLTNAIKEIINDKSYLERSLLYSKISRKYNGPINATNSIINYLQELNKAKLE